MLNARSRDRGRLRRLGWILGVASLHGPSACSERGVELVSYESRSGGAGATNLDPAAQAAAGSMYYGAAGNAVLAGSAGTGHMRPPELIVSVDISRGGPMTRVMLGDVNGDGQLDIVTVQHDTPSDGDFPHSVASLTAFRLDGTLLWQIGNVWNPTQGSRSNLPAQIYDIDGDGSNEILAVMQDELRIFDGRTGALKSTRALPDPDAHDGLLIANFEGATRANDIVLKNRFNRLWAFGHDHQQLFTFSAAIGYFPWPFDWDGDGRDELMAGCNLLDSDGTLLWSCEEATDTVVSGIWAADLDQNPGNGREILVSGGDTLAYNRAGKQLWRADTVDAENIVVGDFRRELPGLEVAGLDRVDTSAANSRDALFLLSSQGVLLWKEERPVGSDWGTIVNMVRHWDDTARDLILAYNRRNVLPTLYDGNFNVVATFPDSDALAMGADVCGDAREEVVTYTDSYVHVYGSSGCDLNATISGKPRPQVKALYNWSRNWGGDYP